MAKNTAFAREGYLRENYHYFHLRDTAGQERDFHFHEFDKIVLLLSGRVDYFVESEVYALEPWSLLLVKHHTIHKALIDKSEPYDRVIIYLDRKYFERIFPDMGIMDSFDAADRLGRHLLTPTEAEREELKRCLRDYEQCEADNGAGAQARYADNAAAHPHPPHGRQWRRRRAVRSALRPEDCAGHVVHQ